MAIFSLVVTIGLVYLYFIIYLPLQFGEVTTEGFLFLVNVVFAIVLIVPVFLCGFLTVIVFALAFEAKRELRDLE